MKSFLFTCGDVNGIGPEIMIKALDSVCINENCIYIFAIPENIYNDACFGLNIKLNAKKIKNAGEIEAPGMYILTMENAEQNIGKPTAASGKTAYDSIMICLDYMKANPNSALITAPISKTAFKLAEIDFPGHTELLAEWCNSADYVMMFLSNIMKAALLTIHSPISAIKGQVTKEKLKRTLDVIIHTLNKDFKCGSPKVAVLGLNPHAGENGNIGTEELEIIAPVVDEYSRKIDIEGPFPPDAFFGSLAYKKFDFILGMYHDQVLIPFKLLNFSKGVNFTAGLPIIRTSPDHGTAYDIAGKGLADCSSTVEAYKFANIILSNRQTDDNNF
jgi:4-hydroxythreonine-4-phosphate dehydrogenase